MSWLGNSKPKADISAAEKIIYINYNASIIIETKAYYGEELFYISTYNKDDKEFIGILDKDYNLIMNVEKKELKAIEETKNKDYVI